MDKLWITTPTRKDRWLIMSVDGWGICKIKADLPNDPTGELTARALVAEHNEAVEERSGESDTPSQSELVAVLNEVVDCLMLRQ